MLDVDLAVIGAGPVGLCFAAAMAAEGLRVALLDRKTEQELANPQDDGREIALTLRSITALRGAKLWDRVPAAVVSPIREARVFNGSSMTGLRIVPSALSGYSSLGSLVPNHSIRRAGFEIAQRQRSLRWFTGVNISALDADFRGVILNLEGLTPLRAGLVVSADSRFSETRQRMGIPAQVLNFGKSMMVCRMGHEVPHDGVAWEWFAHGMTLARLPLNEGCSSIVITVPHPEACRMQTLAPERLQEELERRFEGRLGRLRLMSERFVYPLIGVYSRRFVASRYALLGDAAVGMHPVTAHGFNFGLVGHAELSNRLSDGRRRGRDIGDAAVLAGYEQALRKATTPLFLATNAIVGLFTDERPPARLLRKVLLDIAPRALPVGSILSRLLTSSRREASIP